MRHRLCGGGTFLSDVVQSEAKAGGLYCSLENNDVMPALVCVVSWQ